MQGFTKKIIIICLLVSFYICGCGRTDIANMKKEKDVASESLNAKNEFELFSRELSEDECYELAVFKYQYEKDGRAPAKEIVKVEKKGEVDTDLLCICLEDNIIYIPERLLEDEEFLQITDYMEKGNYEWPSLIEEKEREYDEYKKNQSPVTYSKVPEKNPEIRYCYGKKDYAYFNPVRRKLKKYERYTIFKDYMSGSVPGKKSTDDTKKDTVYIGSGTLCLSEIKKTDAKKMVIDGSVTFADCNYMCDDEERVVMPEYDSWFSKCPNVKNIKVTSATYISNDNAWKAEGVNCTFAAGDLYVKNNILMYRYKTQGVFACPIPQKGIVEIPEKTENIYDSAFLKCQKITKVKIPATVKKIGSAAFGYNSAMKKIEVDKSSKYLKTVDGVLYSKDGKILYAYPSGKKDKIFCVPENVCAIADGAFMGASNLQKIILSSKVEYVGVRAFMDCKRLRQVKSKNEIKFMMASAFLNCKKMKKYPQVEGETKVDGRV